MTVLTFRMRFLILLAYLFAAVWPVLASGEGRQQSEADHQQMMAMAGHLDHMPATDGQNDLPQLLLCQQHCLFAPAALPTPNRGAETIARATDVEVRFDLRQASLAIPPPGPPPKVAVI